MNILVLIRMVPDVVEELEVAPGGKALDTEFLRMIASESDDHALEEALLLKEQTGGTVTVMALEAPEVDEVLFTALAKGADRAIKVRDGSPGLSTRAAVHMLARAIEASPELQGCGLVLTGVQAIDDLDALAAPVLSYLLGRPYVGIVTQVRLDAAGKAATVLKEYPGGVHGEFEVPLPAVLGIQAAEKPPRYVPVSKVRAVMKTQRIAETQVAEAGGLILFEVREMAKHEPAAHAEMLEGTPESIAEKVGELLASRGLL